MLGSVDMLTTGGMPPHRPMPAEPCCESEDFIGNMSKGSPTNSNPLVSRLQYGLFKDACGHSYL